MPESEHVSIELTLNINGEFHVHHHHHHNSPQPGAADIINSIQDLRTSIMTQLDTSTAKETGDFQTLLTAVNGLEDAFNALKGQNNTALQAALDAANLDSATQAAILDANDTAIEGAIAKVNTLLNPTSTVAGGQGDDSVTGGDGTDTTGGGQGSDTITGPAELSVTSSSTNLPDAVTGQAYTGHIDISGGQPPYSVQVSTATVNGLTMDASGVVTGTSTADGTVSFDGTVADSSTPNQHATFSASFNSAPAIESV